MSARWQRTLETRLAGVVERAAGRLVPPPSLPHSPGAEAALLALRRIRSQNRFLTHLVGWAVISLFLGTIINLGEGDGTPGLVIAGVWGAGVLVHGFWALGRRRRPPRPRQPVPDEEPAADPSAAAALRDQLLETAEEVRDVLRPVSPETLAEVSRGEARALTLVSWLAEAESLLEHQPVERRLRRRTATRLAASSGDASLRRLLERLDRNDRRRAVLERRVAELRGRLESFLLALENVRIAQAGCCDLATATAPISERVALLEAAAGWEPPAAPSPTTAAGGSGTERIRHEVRLAQDLQRSILPAAAPEVAGLDVAHLYRPSSEVGGDFYDFYVTGAGRLLVAVGDASGHGLDSSMVSSMAKSALYMQISANGAGGERLAAALAEINRMMCDTLGRRRLMSLTLVEIDTERQSVSWVNAGQVYPLLRRGGEVCELEQPSYPLGVRREVSYPVREVALEPGDLLLLLTDGYVEAQDGAGDPLGWQRLVDRLVGSTVGEPGAVLGELAADLEAHLGDAATAQDDVTLVAVGYRPVPGLGEPAVETEPS